MRSVSFTIIIIIIIEIIAIFLFVVIIIVIIIVVVVTILLFSEPYSFFFQLSFCKTSIDQPFTCSFNYLTQDKKRPQHQPQHQLCETLNLHFHTR